MNNCRTLRSSSIHRTVCRWQLILVASVYLASGLSPFVFAQSDDLTTGMRYFALKKYGKAAEFLQKGLRQNPRRADCHKALAICFFKEGELQAALSEFNVCARIDPKVKIDSKYMAEIYLGLGRRREAVQLYTDAIAHDPDDAGLRYGRAQALIGMCDYTHAITDLSRAIAIKPKEAKFFKERGQAYSKLKEYARAVDDYAESIKLKPTYDSLCNRGDCMMLLVKYKEAVADYSSAIKSNPERTRAYVSRAKAYEKSGRADLAAADRKLLHDRGDTFD